MIKKDKPAKLPTWFGGAADKLKGTKLYLKLKDIVDSVKEWPVFRRKHYVSLYIGLLAATVLGIVASVGVYALLQVTATYIIDTTYTTEELQDEREQQYINELQAHITERGLSSSDTDSILDWDTGTRYVSLIIYNDVFTDDEGEVVTGEELRAYAEETGLYILELSDGVLLASVNDFSHFYYYNLSATVSLIVAMIVLAFMIINHFRSIISRIKRLESDVAVVSYRDMNHRIETKGYDDIAKLSANVETMRETILENLRKEQEARNANTDLITSLSHDIRTPLTVMLGYLEMMKDRTEDAELRKYIDVTENTAMRLKQLSDDMFKYFLAFGNMEEQIAMEEYDAETLIVQMFSEHLLLLGESGYEVNLREEAVLPEGTRVLTDADNLMRIVDNIFSNLYKYADKAHPVSLEIQRIGDVIVFEFKNRILEDTSGAESNRIGLKTCSRLASFITESFEYYARDGIYTTRLALKIILPGSEAEREDTDL